MTPTEEDLIRALTRLQTSERRILELCDEAEHMIGEPAAWLLAAKIRAALRTGDER